MGIDVHGNARIGMSHQILQALDVHTGMGHLGTKGTPEHMGCDFRQRLIRMQLAVLLQCPLKMMFNVHCHLGIAVLVQKQKSGISVDQPFLCRTLSFGKDGSWTHALSMAHIPMKISLTGNLIAVKIALFHGNPICKKPTLYMPGTLINPIPLQFGIDGQEQL